MREHVIDLYQWPRGWQYVVRLSGQVIATGRHSVKRQAIREALRKFKGPYSIRVVVEKVK